MSRIAVAGAGLIGKEHLLRLAVSPTGELASIVDPSPVGVELAATYGVAAYPSLSAMIAADPPDGVVIATPNQLHFENALECIEAGLPILLEKPVTDSQASGNKLLRRAEDLGAKVLVGHHRTHSSIMAAARATVASGAIGDVVAVTGTALFYKPDDYFDIAPWRRRPGGGPILINLIHEIHNLRILCGDITSVYTHTTNRTRGFPVEDTAAMVFTFASGAVGTFVLSDTVGSPRSWEQTSGENRSYSSYPEHDCYHVAGTMGSLSIPTMRLTRFDRPEDRSWWKPFQTSTVPVTEIDPLVAQMEHFVAVIRGEAQPLCTLRDGLQNVRVVDAVTESAASGRAVAISG